MKTTIAKKETVQRDWYHVDGDGQVVGRLAVRLAMMLMGKHKPIYTPHVDCGDFVVVTNCEKVVFTGRKWEDKVYRRHTGHIGGLVEETAGEVLAKHPDRILRKAVQRMLPKTKLADAMLLKLKIYSGAEHPHAAQNPKELTINARRK
jgi:large subunit ribosomal protein L13